MACRLKRVRCQQKQKSRRKTAFLLPARASGWKNSALGGSVRDQAGLGDLQAATDEGELTVISEEQQAEIQRFMALLSPRL